ncbi:hypothetical protein CLAIMM_14468 [Cladophialophora immunda]|nr:hypothetical protein CLAIMM_14468 [Cladophialophora immunda]
MSSAASPACKKLLIFGATGLIGSRITREIVRNKSKFERIAVFTSQGTSESKASELQGLEKEGVDIIVGDITKSDDVVKAYQDIDTVISCVGRNVIEHQIELARLANDSPSVHRFFPSEYGTDIAHGPASAHEKPHQKKLLVRAALQTCDRLDYTYVVTGPYADGEPGLYFGANPVVKEAGTFDVKNKEAVLLGDGNLKVSFTTMKDVGKLVVLAALHPDASRNKALRVNSFTATDSEILKEFEKQTGGQPGRCPPYATIFTLKRIWAEGGTLYDKRDNDLIEAENVMETLADAVAEAIRVGIKFRSVKYPHDSLVFSPTTANIGRGLCNSIKSSPQTRDKDDMYICVAGWPYMHIMAASSASDLQNNSPICYDMGQKASKPDPNVRLQVIGCGMSRTGTASFSQALEILLGGPHTPIEDESDRNVVLQGLKGLLSGYTAVTDMPPVLFTEELVELFPDAKVICTTRDPESWWKSMEPVAAKTDTEAERNERVLAFLLALLPTMRYWKAFSDALRYGRFGELFYQSGHNHPHPGQYGEHMEYVKRVVPPERLWFYDIKQGWGPLCKILDCDVPNVPFPRVNDAEATDRIIRTQIQRGMLAWTGAGAVVVVVGIGLWRTLWTR